MFLILARLGQKKVHLYLKIETKYVLWEIYFTKCFRQAPIFEIGNNSLTSFTYSGTFLNIHNIDERTQIC
jgi:hypothetical protein